MIIRKAQSIFEYFILTAIVAAVVLACTSSTQFESIKDSFNKVFAGTCARIIE